MKVINVTIKEERFKIYVVFYQGKDLYVAEPRLEEAILDCIENNEYYDTIASIEGKECKVSDVSDLYYYVYGDEEDDNPTEQDVIDSVEDVWEGHPD